MEVLRTCERSGPDKPCGEARDIEDVRTLRPAKVRFDVFPPEPLQRKHVFFAHHVIPAVHRDIQEIICRLA